MIKSVQRFGFTLIELMVVVTIIGIISAIAIPSYQKYVVKSKMAEAYTILGSMHRSQTAYYAENGDFLFQRANPNDLVGSMTIEQSDDFDLTGYPVPIGSNVFFSYLSVAGKTDSSGTEETSPSHPVFYPSDVTTIFKMGTTTNTACNYNYTPSSIGVTPVASYDWVIIAAVGDLDGQNADQLCTVVAQLIESSPATDNKPKAGGFILLNYGK